MLWPHSPVSGSSERSAQATRSLFAAAISRSPRPVAFARGRSCSACAAAPGGRGPRRSAAASHAARRACASPAWCTRRRECARRSRRPAVAGCTRARARVRPRQARRLLGYGRWLRAAGREREQHVTAGAVAVALRDPSKTITSQLCRYRSTLAGGRGRSLLTASRANGLRRSALRHDTDRGRFRLVVPRGGRAAP